MRKAAIIQRIARRSEMLRCYLWCDSSVWGNLSGEFARNDSPFNELAKPLDSQQPVCAVATFREVMLDSGEDWLSF